MAFKRNTKRNLASIEIVSVNDDAIDTEKSDLEEYKKTGELKHLVFVPGAQPTRFLCNFEVQAKHGAAIKNGMLAGRDESGDPQVTLGTWAHRVVKYTLKGITNPDSMSEEDRFVFKTDEHQMVHDDLLGALDRHGVVDEIFGFYTKLALGGAKDNAKN